MGIYNVHAGHSLICRGASALLDEVTEDRKVADRVIQLLQTAGHTVYNCTDDSGETQNDNLRAIVSKCNAHNVDLDISIHLNAGRNDSTGDGSTGGVEVIGYNANTQEIGSKIASGIASALNIRNRGFKTNTGLYVLKSTKAQAILIECCFVDDKDDADRWNATKCAEAIVKAMIGTVPAATTSTSATTTVCKYSIGQEVSYGTSYPSPTLPCGIQYATGGSGHGKIIAIVSGQAKYQLSSGVYVNDGDISGLYIAPVNNSVNVYYKVYSNGQWYSEVKNLEDYAGDSSHPIKGLMIMVDSGSVKYRVHTKRGRWYPYVAGYNKDDHNNGFAGDLINDIDAVEVVCTDVNGKRTSKKAKYRVAPVDGGNYYPWQINNEFDIKMDGYAGAFGKSIGKFQIVIE